MVESHGFFGKLGLFTYVPNPKLTKPYIPKGFDCTPGEHRVHTLTIQPLVVVW